MGGVPGKKILAAPIDHALFFPSPWVEGKIITRSPPSTVGVDGRILQAALLCSASAFPAGRTWLLLKSIATGSNRM